jgi:nucleoid DNA-binding protein
MDRADQARAPSSSRMKREELARKLARQNKVSSAQARDQVDEMVRKILKALRQGQPVELPGVGRLVSKSKKQK